MYQRSSLSCWSITLSADGYSLADSEIPFNLPVVPITTYHGGRDPYRYNLATPPINMHPLIPECDSLASTVFYRISNCVMAAISYDVE